MHEYQGKALFAEYGLPVSVGQAVGTPDAAEAAAKAIGGDKWVVNAEWRWPGAIQFARMPSRPCQAAVVWVKIWRAPFDTE